jgi:hypothetical protein
MSARHWRSLAFATLAAVVLVTAVACSSASSRRGGALRVTVTGHAEWVGGPSSAPQAPAAGVRMRVLKGSAEVSTGSTDAGGDFSWALGHGSYELLPDPTSGCPSKRFTVPVKADLALTCQRR